MPSKPPGHIAARQRAPADARKRTPVSADVGARVTRMTELVFVIVALLILVVLGGLVASRKKGGAATSGSLPYQSTNALFSATERSFLGILDRAVGSDYRVFGKVRVADVVAVKSGLSNSARQIAVNRVAAKHLDFVVCRAADLSLVCAVELNDKSHSSQRAQARDQFVAQVCRTVGLPLLTVQAQRAYSVQDIQLQFTSLVSPPAIPSNG